MICPRCGTINGDGAERCTRCQGSLAPPPPREEIDAAREDTPAAVALKRSDTERSGHGEGSDDIPAGPWSAPPPETPTWPPPWPAPTGSPWAPPPGPPGPPADTGQWPPPAAPTGPPGQWPPPPAGPPGQWPPAAPAPLTQWPPAPPPGQPGQWPPPTAPGQWPPSNGSPPPAPHGLGRVRRDTSKPNYLPWAILCTLLFNLIGIVAIVYCVVANRRFAAGDVDGGMHATQLARTWCWISVIVGLVGLLLLASGVIHFPSTGNLVPGGVR